MARNTEYNTVNRDLHDRWVELCSQDPDDRQVKAAKGRLGNDVVIANKAMLGAAIRQFTARNPDLEPDLFDTAAAELWRVFQKWDPERATLHTAAKTYIRGAVQRVVAAYDHPHLSYDDFTLRGKVVELQSKFVSQHDREPTDQELADAAKIPVQKLRVLFAGKPLSLDHPAPGGDEDSTLGAIVADENSYSAEVDMDDTEFSLGLDPSVAAAINPVTLLTYLMKQGDGAGPGARSPEIAYLLGLADHGKNVPRDVTQVSLQNARVVLTDLLGEEPTAEQLMLATGATEKVASEYLTSVAD